MARRSQRIRRQRRIERMRAKQQEAKLNKVVEDNSVILERMRNVSDSCDKMLQTLDNTQEVTTPDAVNETEPLLKTEQPVPDLKEPAKTIIEKPNYKKMTKKALVNLAKELDLKLSTTMTKANIIKAIEANQ